MGGKLKKTDDKYVHQILTDPGIESRSSVKAMFESGIVVDKLTVSDLTVCTYQRAISNPELD